MRHIVLCLLLVLGTGAARAADDTVTYQTRDTWVTRHLKNGGNIDSITGLARSPDWKKGARFIAIKTDGEDLPKAYDWRKVAPKGLQPIKNQGSCGSCWAFSITAVLEAQMKIQQPDATLPILSEQTLVDCSDYDCNGGDFDAFNYVRDKGLASRVDYPYSARNGRCKVKDTMAKTKVVSWAYVGDGKKSPTTEQIKAAILKYGPVSVDVSASGAFMSYGSGIYNSCNAGSINHMTNIEGWDDADGGYWIMRNSWGADWGEDGYMRIRYTDKHGNKCNRIGDTAAVAVYQVPGADLLPEE